MKVIYERSFLRDLKKIKDRNLKQTIEEIITIAKRASSPAEIPHLKKIKGSENYFRIRIGTYRIGIKITGNTFIFIRVLSRKDIYRYFP